MVFVVVDFAVVVVVLLSFLLGVLGGGLLRNRPSQGRGYVGSLFNNEEHKGGFVTY